MQPMTAAGSCNPSHYPFRTTHVTLARPAPAGNADEVARLKAELARVKRELRDLKYATQQFVRSCL